MRSMGRGLGAPALGLCVAAVVLLFLWAPGRSPSPDPAGDEGIAGPPSPAPPPSLAGQSLERHVREETGAPAARDVRPAPRKAKGLIEGRVLGADGEPIRGAVVRTVPATDPPATATTDEEGRFAFELAGPVPTQLVVSAPGFADALVTLDARTAALVIPLAKDWSISGTVRDAETGESIVSIAVSARPATSPEATDPRLATWRPDGTFRVTVPGRGAYVLEVGARYIGAAGSALDDWVPTRVEGVAAGTVDLRVTLARGRSIEGEFVDDVGARVMRRLTVDAVRRTAVGDPDYTLRKIVFAEGGVLRVPGLAPGRYDLWVRPDADPADARGALLSSTVVRDVEAGTRGLVVRLQRGFVLTGRLEDGAGGAVTGTGSLLAYPEGERTRSHPVVGEVPGDGTFRIGPLDESGRYDLHAKDFAGRRPTIVSGVSPRDAGVVVVLAGARGIRGRVETEDGTPVPAGVPVGVVAEGTDPRVPGTRAFAETAADGTFAVDGLADTSFTVEAGGGRSGFLGKIVRDVKAGATDLVLRVSVGVDLAGTLVDAQGDPVATTSLVADDGARVAAMRPYAQVGPDGAFLVRGLRAGRVRLSLRIGHATVDAGAFEAPATGLRVSVPER